MIVRLWKGRALPERAEAYKTHVTAAVFPRLAQMKGFLRGRVLCRDTGRHIEFLVMTEWESMTAIRAFAGDTPDVAVVEPAAQAVLSDYDSRVEHFEVIQEVSAAESSPLPRVTR
jgi:heme-degrading monooxygenase HmoA